MVFLALPKRHRLPVPGYNYKDGNDRPGQPNQTHHQKALPVPKPSKLQWCRETSRVDGCFWGRDGSRAGERQERCAPAPGARLFPALTWEYVTYFWKGKKNYKMSPSPSCIANSRGE